MEGRERERGGGVRAEEEGRQRGRRREPDGHADN